MVILTATQYWLKHNIRIIHLNFLSASHCKHIISIQLLKNRSWCNQKHYTNAPALWQYKAGQERKINHPTNIHDKLSQQQNTAGEKQRYSSNKHYQLGGNRRPPSWAVCAPHQTSTAPNNNNKTNTRKTKTTPHFNEPNILLGFNTTHRIKKLQFSFYSYTNATRSL